MTVNKLIELLYSVREGDTVDYQTLSQIQSAADLLGELTATISEAGLAYEPPTDISGIGTRTIKRDDFGGWAISPGPHDAELMKQLDDYGNLIDFGETVTIPQFQYRIGMYKLPQRYK